MQPILKSLLLVGVIASCTATPSGRCGDESAPAVVRPAMHFLAPLTSRVGGSYSAGCQNSSGRTSGSLTIFSDGSVEAPGIAGDLRMAHWYFSREVTGATAPRARLRAEGEDWQMYLEDGYLLHLVGPLDMHCVAEITAVTVLTNEPLDSAFLSNTRLKMRCSSPADPSGRDTPVAIEGGVVALPQRTLVLAGAGFEAVGGDKGALEFFVAIFAGDRRLLLNFGPQGQLTNLEISLDLKTELSCTALPA